MPIALKKESLLPPLQVGAQFVRQRRQDRHVTISLAFGVCDVDLRRIAVEEQILHADVDELIDSGCGLKQRLDHQAVFALNAVGGLNETLPFASIQAVYRSIARVWRFQRQAAPDAIHDIFGLIVAEMMPAPKAEGLLDDLVERMRNRCLTTQFVLRRAFQSGHCDLKSVELLRSNHILRSSGFYAGWNHGGSPVPEKSTPKVNWQPISALPLISSMIDGLLDEVEKQNTNLAAGRSKPHVFDNHTVARVIKVYSAQAEDLWLYEGQLSRWKALNLTPSQRQEVDRLVAQIPTIRERITAILALAEELKGSTIESVLAKSDLELGLEVLLGVRTG